MRRALRTGLAISAGGMALLALDAMAKRRGGRAASARRALLAFVRPAPIPDNTAMARVRSKLARTASAPDAIRVTIEHGCVELRGAVSTRERARIVKEVASVKGVDAVVDLMTEPHLASSHRSGGARAAPPETALARTRPMWHWPLPRAAWSPAARILAVGSGLGLATAALGLGSRALAIPAAVLGVGLFASGATARSHPLRLRRLLRLPESYRPGAPIVLEARSRPHEARAAI